MVMIKYYKLESNSKKEVSTLERNLKKYLLHEKHVIANHRTRLQNFDQKLLEDKCTEENQTTNLVVYDLGEFDILYKRVKTLYAGQKAKEGKKRWYWKDRPEILEIPPRIESELVVKATQEDILELQNYLSSSGFEVVEARSVHEAAMTLITSAGAKDFKISSATQLDKYITNRYGDKVKADIQVQHNIVNWYGEKGSIYTATISGPVEYVLEIRKLIKTPGYITSYKRESVTFFKQIDALN